MSEQIDPDRLNRLWQHGLHEDAMFSERLNFFLVFETVLLGVVGALYSNPTPKLNILRAIIVFGISITTIWFYIQAKQKRVLDIMRARARQFDPDYAAIVAMREQSKLWRISIT